MSWRRRALGANPEAILQTLAGFGPMKLLTGNRAVRVEHRGALRDLRAAAPTAISGGVTVSLVPERWRAAFVIERPGAAHTAFDFQFLGDSGDVILEAQVDPRGLDRRARLCEAIAGWHASGAQAAASARQRPGQRPQPRIATGAPSGELRIRPLSVGALPALVQAVCAGGGEPLQITVTNEGLRWTQIGRFTPAPPLRESVVLRGDGVTMVIRARVLGSLWAVRRGRAEAGPSVLEAYDDAGDPALSICQAPSLTALDPGPPIGVATTGLSAGW